MGLVRLTRDEVIRRLADRFREADLEGWGPEGAEAMARLASEASHDRWESDALIALPVLDEVARGAWGKAAEMIRLCVASYRNAFLTTSSMASPDTSGHARVTLDLVCRFGEVLSRLFDDLGRTYTIPERDGLAAEVDHLLDTLDEPES